MDISRGLITKIIDQQQINHVTRSGITQEFIDEDCIPVYNYIKRHFTDYKDVPSRDAVLKAFPNFQFADYKEPLQYFIDAVKEAYRKNILEDSLVDVSKVYQKDTKEAETKIRDALAKLSITEKSFQDINIAKSALDRIEAYDKKKENPGADGILSGWDKVDYLTLGWHAEEFIILVGDKYVGKSWLMLWMAYKAMLQNERVLFVTKEMSQKALANRFDSIYSSVKFDSLRRGELSEVEEERYKKSLKDFSESNYHLLLARNGVATLQDVEQKAVEIDASICFVDSVYLFSPDQKTIYGSEVARRREVSQRCKQSAQTLGIPYVAATQARRKTTNKDVADLDDIEWSNAFSQDADAVLRITKNEIDRDLGRLKLHVLKSRDGDIGQTYIRTDFEYMTFNEDNSSVEPSTEIDVEDEFKEGDMWS